MYNFQIYKLFQDQELPINISNVRKGDIIKVKDLDTEKFLSNEEGIEAEIVIEDAKMNEDESWTVLSKAYELKDESVDI